MTLLQVIQLPISFKRFMQACCTLAHLYYLPPPEPHHMTVLSPAFYALSRLLNDYHRKSIVQLTPATHNLYGLLVSLIKEKLDSRY